MKMAKQLKSKWKLEQVFFSKLIKERVIKRPDFQRLLDEDKVKEMISSFLDQIDSCGYLHTVEEITIAESPNCIWIIDGQHRYKCFLQLLQKHTIDVPVDIRSIRVENKEEANYWFSIVNKATPMPQLPDGIISYANANDLIKAIMKTFPQKPRRNKKGLFDINPNAKAPRMDKNFFIERVSNYLQNNPLGQRDFMDRLITLNNEVRERVEKGDFEYFRSRGLDWTDKIFKQRFETCKKDCGGFCLGIFRKHGWIEMVFEEKDDVVHSLNKKQKIPQTLKTLLWEKTFPNKYKGKCAVCNRSNINALNFEAGHVLSEKNGGEIRLDNLRPICSACNKSQGTRDMSEVIRQIQG